MKPHLFAEEADIIDGLRQGNDLAVKVLYKSHYPAVHHYVLSNSGNEDNAREVYQQAFVILIEKLQDDHFELSSSAGTFLFAVSKNLWLARLKERKRFKNDGNENGYERIDEELNMADILKQEQDFELMYKCLEEIGESCNNLLTGFYLQQKSMDVLAAELGYTNSDNAKNQKYKCLQRLKKLFKTKQKQTGKESVEDQR